MSERGEGVVVLVGDRREGVVGLEVGSGWMWVVLCGERKEFCRRGGREMVKHHRRSSVRSGPRDFVVATEKCQL